MRATKEGRLHRPEAGGSGLAERLASDARYALVLVRAIRRMTGVGPWSRTTVADVLEGVVDRRPEAQSLRYGGRVMSYRTLDERANRHARWGLAQGLEPGDVVALLMGNDPDYVCAVFGMAKIGVVTALINTHLSSRSLAHGLDVSRAKLAIVGGDRQEAWESALPFLERRIPAWVAGPPARIGEDLLPVLEAHPGARLTGEHRRGVHAGDPFCFVYTSGTSGLPKAARISHFRYLTMAAWASAAVGLEPADRAYVPLPLYHAAGFALGLGGALTSGATVVLAPRFSARSFWRECVEHRATTFHYIGELCRYLLNSPACDEELRHSVRCAIGNGLRPDVWEPFQKRFGIPRIIEFYGLTEGNVVVANLDNRIGSVGRVPALVRATLGPHLLRYDVERDEPVRDERGRCVPCRPGEVGEAVGRITPLTRFEGYSDPAATEERILRDVFRSGDAFFRTGDLLTSDEAGYFYFVDRIGDTFRWKGENVSTTEIAEVLTSLPSIREAAVYGVSVPGAEGRAGMAAVVAAGALDLGELARVVLERLAPFARPLFLRICARLETTGTFKHRKLELIDEGYDPQRVDDPLFLLDAAGPKYVPIDRALHRRIEGGEIRL